MQAIQTEAFTRPSQPKLTICRLADLAHQETGVTRGYAHIGFDDYPKPAPGRLDFGDLLLFAQGELFPGETVAMHPHSGHDNIGLLLSGKMRHEDSLGNKIEVSSDAVSVMLTGSGIEHAETVVGDENLKCLVIWLRSSSTEPPVARSRSFPRVERINRLVTLMSGRNDAPDTAVKLRADAAILSAVLEPDAHVSYTIEPGRRGYLMTTEGSIEINGHTVGAGERVLVEDGGTVDVRAVDATEVILIDQAG